MTFKFFKISLVSVAKLPHTDTYYACFEHNTIENAACIVNFNDKIDYFVAGAGSGEQFLVY